MKIIFASHNKEKQEEVKRILKDVDIVTLTDLNDHDEVLENGKSLEENAFLKANHYYKKYDMPVISDDTGLFVEALNGAPGVYSARYSDEGTYKSNNEKLLVELKDATNRKATFKCVVCYIDKEGRVKYFYGNVDGEIVSDSNNINKGFGYDSLFYVKEYQKTYYEMTKEIKNKISHRFLALNEFVMFLRESSWIKMIEFNANSILDRNDAKVESRLLGGMSNYTYVVSSDDEEYTIRFPGEYAEEFVNREHEARNIKLMEYLKVTNKTIYFDITSGIKMSRYVSGKPLSEFNGNYDYEAVSNLLKTIHNSKNLSLNDYKPFERLEKYQSLLDDSDIDLEFFNTKNEFLKYKDYLDSQEKVLTHGDSQPSNFILDSDNNLLTVDFEFSGNNDPIYDIVCFANIRLEEGLKLLEVYYKDVDNDKLKRFYLWRTYQALQWYLVASFKEKVGLSESLKIDFKKVALNYLHEAQEMLRKQEKL